MAVGNLLGDGFESTATDGFDPPADSQPSPLQQQGTSHRGSALFSLAPPPRAGGATTPQTASPRVSSPRAAEPLAPPRAAEPLAFRSRASATRGVVDSPPRVAVDTSARGAPATRFGAGGRGGDAMFDDDPDELSEELPLGGVPPLSAPLARGGSSENSFVKTGGNLVSSLKRLRTMLQGTVGGWGGGGSRGVGRRREASRVPPRSRRGKPQRQRREMRERRPRRGGIPSNSRERAGGGLKLQRLLLRVTC